jgi:ParB-like chromosome segregation protein Spo0J
VKVERLFIADVETGDRLRAVTPERVAGIKASIAEIGLRTPITVAAARDGDEWHFRLVAGAHRLEALRQLGEEFVEAYVMEGSEDDAALWEIDENFARAELTDAQRADHHVRREEILKRKGLVSSHGGARKQNDKLSSCSYAERASADLGVDRRTVQRDLARGKKIAPEVLAEVAGTDLDKGVVLDELARAPAAQQPALLDEIRARREAHKLNAEHNRVIALTDAEQFAEWLMARTDLDELPTIISWLEGTKAKDVIAALRREAA